MDQNVIPLNANVAADMKPGAVDKRAEPLMLDAGQPIKAAEVSAPAAVAENAPKKRGGKSFLLGGVAIILVAGAIWYAHDYWTVGRFLVTTDDAYIKADSSAIAPKISGYLQNVLVADNQQVKAGQILAKIDDRDYSTALDQAAADVDAAKAMVDAKQSALDIQRSMIDAAKATLDIDHANETFAGQNDKRYSHLAVNGYAPMQTAEQAASQITATHAVTARDTATLAATTKQVELLAAELAQAKAALAHDVAVRHQAELNVSYASIVAPVDGVVGNRTLRVGQYVQAGTQLMTVVPTSQAYIVANYKETQLTDVRPGMPVDIDVDMYPGKAFHGHVDSLAPASGQEFALLPPDNATGNFTKVVQRIPVRIVLDADSSASGDLRPGMSVQPSIDTKNSH